MFRMLCALCASLPFFAGCSGGTAPEKIYDVKGKIVSIDRDKKSVTLDHEEIPGFMKAMKMSFPVEDIKILEGLAPGDDVEGKLKAVDGKQIVTAIHKKGERAETDATDSKIKANLAKLSPEDRQLAEQQRVCVVNDEPLGSMGVPIKLTFAEGSAFICCKGCEKAARKNESATLRKAAELKKK